MRKKNLQKGGMRYKDRKGRLGGDGFPQNGDKIQGTQKSIRTQLNKTKHRGGIEEEDRKKKAFGGG